MNITMLNGLTTWFSLRRGGIFNKVGKVRRNEDDDADWTYDLFL